MELTILSLLLPMVMMTVIKLLLVCSQEHEDEVEDEEALRTIEITVVTILLPYLKNVMMVTE